MRSCKTKIINLTKDLTVSDLAYLKYVIFLNINQYGTFLRYKNLLGPSQRGIDLKNFKQTFIV